MANLRYLAVAVLAVATAACATLNPDSPTEEKVKVVTERATARWQAVIGGDFARGIRVPVAGIAGDGDTGGIQDHSVAAGHYREAKVTGSTCEAQTCKVRLLNHL